MHTSWSSAAALVRAAVVAAAAAAPKPFEPSLLDHKYYSETNTLIAYLEDGTYVQGAVAVSNIGLGNARGTCHLLMSRPQAAAVNLTESFEHDAWSFVAAPSPSLHMGPCRATATSTALHLDMNLHDRSVMLTLDAAAHPTVPPGHPVRLDDGFYASDITVPFAPATVVLAQGDAPPLTLRGMGYADHSRSTTLPKDLARGWLRFRGFSQGRCGHLLLVRLPKGDAPPVGYHWRQGAAAPEALVAPNVQLPAQGVSPADLRVALQAGALNLSIRGKRLILREAPLDAYGLLGSVISGFVGKLMSETYEAVLDDHAGCGAVGGVLEVDHIGG